MSTPSTSSSSARPLSTLPLAPSTLQLLRRHGFETQQEVLGLGPVALAQELGVESGEALRVLKAVQNAVEVDEEKKASVLSAVLTPVDSDSSLSALDLLHKKRARYPIFTMNRRIDDMLGGGVQRGEVTEFCGVPGIGKTQMSIQLACNVQVPAVFRGVEGEAVYVDTEGSFLPERAFQIAQGLVQHLRAMADGAEDTNPVGCAVVQQMSVEQVLRRVHVFRVYDYVEQLSCVKGLPAFLHEHPRVRLLIIDSVAFHFRRDFKDMALRSRLLAALSQDLVSLAQDHDLAVVLMNQVTTKVYNRASAGPAHLVPALGETWAHACTNRVMLEWSADEQRQARLIKSPYRKESTAAFAITRDGVRDPPSSSAASSSGGIKRKK